MATVALGLLVAVPSQAAAQGGILDVYGGIGIPVSSIIDFAKSGFSGGIGIGYIGNRSYGIRADFAGEWLSGKSDVLESIPSIPELDFGAGVDIRLYHYDASVMINLSDPRSEEWIVALDVGAGATTINFSGDGASGVGSKTRFTIPAGLSVGYMVSDNVGLFIRGRWYLIFMSDEDFGSSTWSTIPIWAGFGIRAR
jgi:hypothetical protein